MNSSLLELLLPLAYKELGLEAPIDIIINSLQINTPEKEYVEKGENSFSIKDNAFDLTTTISFEAIAFLDEPRFGGWIWKLFRAGYAKFNLGGTFTQVNSTL